MPESITMTVSWAGPPADLAEFLSGFPQFPGLGAAASAPPPASAAKAETDGGNWGEIYEGPNSGPLVSLDRAHFKLFYEGIHPSYKKGVRLLAEGGGIVSCDKLAKKGIRNPGHFKSRTSLRAKTALGMDRRVQFARYRWKEEKGQTRWYLEVPAATQAAMVEYFGKKADG